MEYVTRANGGMIIMKRVFEIQKWKFNKWAMKSDKEFQAHVERYKKLRGGK
jgi:hypothetical protein